MTLQGRVALVTGGSHGIGKAIVQRLLQEGARVAFCARNRADLKAAADELSTIGPEILPFRADVTDGTQVEGFVAAALDRFANIDILVNNAAIYGPIGPAWENDARHWEQTLAVNLLGPVRVCRAVVPAMIRVRRGKIINLSGGGAAAPFARFSAYAASKAAVVRFTETLAVELAEYNVQVNAVAPGFVGTRIHQQTLEAGERAGLDFLRKTQDVLANGPADATAAAALVAFLGSERSLKITGRFIHAVWDGWPNFPSHVHEIDSGDLYTLRRIVPSDRGMSWK